MATTTKTDTTKTTASKSGKASSKPTGKTGKMEDSEFHKFFVDELKDIYWAEKHLAKALPKMKKAATSPELAAAFEKHAEETQGHVATLEQVFELLGEKASAKKCDAMEGLIEEGKGILEETELGVVRDAGIIAASQKIEHYEIASYGTLRQFAETLGLEEAAALLEETLDEEKGADKKLTDVAVNAVNFDAAEAE